jgi:malate synthase
MEDAATAEIARSQVWQWIQHTEGKLDDGRQITLEMVKTMIPEELAKILEAHGKAYDEEKMNQATDLFTSRVSGDKFEEFFPISAYDQLE